MSSKRGRGARQRIEDMLRAIERIRRYTAGLRADEFEENELVFDAVVRNFEILGEAAKHVPANLRRYYTDAPWQKIIDEEPDQPRLRRNQCALHLEHDPQPPASP